MQTWADTLLSQFASSPRIIALIQSFNDAMDPSADIANFQTYIWNVNSAVGNGLDIWGRIVGISRTIATASGPMTLSDTDFRTLILARAAANIGGVSSQALNALLTQIFASSGSVSVQDNLDMTITYLFTFPPTEGQQAIIENSGVLPRPAGVQVNYTFPSQPGAVFGFDSGNTYVAGFDIGSWAA